MVFNNTCGNEKEILSYNQSEFCRHESYASIPMKDVCSAFKSRNKLILYYCTCDPMMSRAKFPMGLWYFENGFYVFRNNECILKTCLIDFAMQVCTYLTHCCNYHWKDTDAKG